MQDSYISLDPANADSMNSQQRSRLFNQRKQEANGGEAGTLLANQFGVTTILCSYTYMRTKGFRITPFTAKKVPAVGGLLLAGMIGYRLGSAYSRTVIGN